MSGVSIPKGDVQRDANRPLSDEWRETELTPEGVARPERGSTDLSGTNRDAHSAPDQGAGQGWPASTPDHTQQVREFALTDNASLNKLNQAYI